MPAVPRQQLVVNVLLLLKVLILQVWSELTCPRNNGHFFNKLTPGRTRLAEAVVSGCGGTFLAVAYYSMVFLDFLNTFCNQLPNVRPPIIGAVTRFPIHAAYLVVPSVNNGSPDSYSSYSSYRQWGLLERKAWLVSSHYSTCRHLPGVTIRWHLSQTISSSLVGVLQNC